MAKRRNRPQAPKQRVNGNPYYRSDVALDALGITHGNRRKTVVTTDYRRVGTRRAQINAAMAD